MFLFYLNNYLCGWGALLIMGAKSKCSWHVFGHSEKLDLICLSAPGKGILLQKSQLHKTWLI